MNDFFHYGEHYDDFDWSSDFLKSMSDALKDNTPDNEQLRAYIDREPSAGHRTKRKEAEKLMSRALDMAVHSQSRKVTDEKDREILRGFKLLVGYLIDAAPGKALPIMLEDILKAMFFYGIRKGKGE